MQAKVPFSFLINSSEPIKVQVMVPSVRVVSVTLPLPSDEMPLLLLPDSTGEL